MSFIDREDIYALIEGLLKRVWKVALDYDVPTPFPRISYQEVMNRWELISPTRVSEWRSWISRKIRQQRVQGVQ